MPHWVERMQEAETEELILTIRLKSKQITVSLVYLSFLPVKYTETNFYMILKEWKIDMKNTNLETIINISPKTYK